MASFNLRQLLRSIGRGQGTVPAFLQTVASQLAVLVVNILTGVITARALGADGRGIFAAITFFPYFLGNLFSLGLPNALVVHFRSFATKRRVAVGDAILLGCYLSLAGGLTGIVCVLVTMGHKYSGDVLALSIAAAVVVTWVNIMTLVIRQAFVLENNLTKANKSLWATPIVYLVLLLGAVALLDFDANIAAICQFASVVWALCWLAIRMRSFLVPKIEGHGESFRQLVRFSVRLAPGEIFVVLTAQLDRLLLVYMVSPAELGFYAVAYSLSRVLTLMQVTLTPLVLPTLTNTDLQGAKIFHDRVFRFAFYVLVITFVIVALFGGTAVRILYGPSFADAGTLLLVLTLEAALSCLAYLPGQLLLATGRPGNLSVIQIAAFFVAAAALVILVPPLGPLGAACALAVTALFRLAAILVNVKMALGFNPPGLMPQADDIPRLLAALKRE